MEDKRLYLREKAHSLGMCDEWYSYDWGGMSDGELVSLYKRGIDFCVGAGFPSRGDVVKLFDRSVLESCGVYAHDCVCAGLSSGVYVVIGCSASVSLKPLSSVTFHVIDGGSLRVACSLSCKVQVRLHGGSSVSFVDGELSCPTVITYGDGCVIEGSSYKHIKK